jgi:hypothetical protein
MWMKICQRIVVQLVYDEKYWFTAQIAKPIVLSRAEIHQNFPKAEKSNFFNLVDALWMSVKNVEGVQDELIRRFQDNLNDVKLSVLLGDDKASLTVQNDSEFSLPAKLQLYSFLPFVQIVLEYSRNGSNVREVIPLSYNLPSKGSFGFVLKRRFQKYRNLKVHAELIQLGRLVQKIPVDFKE